MKRLAVLILSVFLAVTISQTAGAGDLRKMWTSAKKDAESKLKSEKQKKLSKYVKLNQDLGPNLDTLEKKAKKSPSGLKIPAIAKDKKLAAAMLKFTKKISADENWLYYTKGYKMKAKKVYDLYINDNADKQLNIDGKLRGKWDTCKNSNKWKPCKALRKETLTPITYLLENDTLPKFMAYLRENPGENPYAEDLGPLKDKITDTCDKYRKMIKGSDIPVAEVKKSLNDTLKKIKTEVNKL